MCFIFEVRLTGWTKGGRKLFLNIYSGGCKENVIEVTFFPAKDIFAKVAHIKPHEVPTFSTKSFPVYKFLGAK